MNKRFIILALSLVSLCLAQAQPALFSAPVAQPDNYFYRSLDLFQTRGYYDDVIGLNGPALKSALHDLIHSTHTTEFSYTAVTDQMRYTDEDPNNTNNVIEIYTGWSVPKSSYGVGITDWNKEHTGVRAMEILGILLLPELICTICALAMPQLIQLRTTVISTLEL